MEMQAAVQSKPSKTKLTKKELDKFKVKNKEKKLKSLLRRLGDEV
jgi:hypothetical protein